MSYSAAEEDLRQLIISNITGFTAHNAVCGTEDAAFAYADANETDVCVIDYHGSSPDRETSSYGPQDNIIWSVMVAFYIRYDPDTVESDIRKLAEDFVNLRRLNKRLDSRCTWRINSIARGYETIMRINRPYIAEVFEISIKEPLA